MDELAREIGYLHEQARENLIQRQMQEHEEEVNRRRERQLQERMARQLIDIQFPAADWFRGIFRLEEVNDAPPVGENREGAAPVVAPPVGFIRDNREAVRRVWRIQPFHAMWRDRPRPPERRRSPTARYVRVARDDRKNYSKCEICTGKVMNMIFIDHLNTCSREKGLNITDKTIHLCKFKCNSYNVSQLIARLRDRLEISYFEANRDKSLLENMDCGRCPSFEAHMEGECLSDHQNSAFLVGASLIEQEIMAICAKYLDLEKQVGLDQITEKYEKSSLMACEFNHPEPSSLELMYERQMVWGDYRQEYMGKMNVEKAEYAEKKSEENLATYNSLRKNIRKQIDVCAQKMVRYIAHHKNTDNLPITLEQRKLNSLDKVEAHCPRRLEQPDQMLQREEIIRMDVDIEVGREEVVEMAYR